MGDAPACVCGLRALSGELPSLLREFRDFEECDLEAYLLTERSAADLPSPIFLLILILDLASGPLDVPSSLSCPPLCM